VGPIPYFELIAAIALTGHEAEAHEEFQHYLASFSKWPKTIAAWEALTSAYSFLMRASPCYREAYHLHFDGLRKAGMPEQ
jgi:hypothetical protein